MGSTSKIEWTEASWTPIRARNVKTGKIGWHCEHATTGCEFCYAEGFNMRLGTRLPFKPGHRKDIEIFLDETMLRAPLHWKKPRMIFVCSMTDAFADFVKDKWLDQMFAVMALCPQHTFQLLTKRAERMLDYMTQTRLNRWMNASLSFGGTPALIGRAGKPLPNVWLGVSVEDQPTAEARIPNLLRTPAAIRFISREPGLGDVDLTMLVHDKGQRVVDATNGCYAFKDGDGWEQAGQGYSLKWVIDGGESGSDRLYDIDASRALEAQCVDNGVAYFRKQLGAHPFERKVSGWPNHIAVGEDSAGRCLLTGFNHKKAGDADEWPADLRRREFPKTRVS